MEDGEVVEMMLRVKKADCNALLQKSGQLGLFFKALHFQNGRDTHRVLWLNRTIKYETARDFCKQYTKSTLGLILGQGGGLGVRLHHGVDRAAAIKWIGTDNLAPMLDPEMRKYTVTGVHHHELQEDIVSSLNKLGWRCVPVARYRKQGLAPTRIIVAATSDPPFIKVSRGTHHNPLIIRRTSDQDRPRHKAEVFKGDISLPKGETEAASMKVDDPLPPGSPKKND